MKINSLLHQTNISSVKSILENGLRSTSKSFKDSDERFIWFDYIGENKENFLMSDTGHTTSTLTGVTFVLDFFKVLKQVVRNDDLFTLLFVSDHVRFQRDTKSVTLWSSKGMNLRGVRKVPDIPDRVSKAIECVIATHSADPVYFDIKNCIKKIIVCKRNAETLAAILQELDMTSTPLVIQEPLSLFEKAYIEHNCQTFEDVGFLKKIRPEFKNLTAKEICKRLYMEYFIANCSLSK